MHSYRFVYTCLIFGVLSQNVVLEKSLNKQETLSVFLRSYRNARGSLGERAGKRKFFHVISSSRKLPRLPTMPSNKSPSLDTINMQVIKDSLPVILGPLTNEFL